MLVCDAKMGGCDRCAVWARGVNHPVQGVTGGGKVALVGKQHAEVHPGCGGQLWVARLDGLLVRGRGSGWVPGVGQQVTEGDHCLRGLNGVGRGDHLLKRGLRSGDIP